MLACPGKLLWRRKPRPIGFQLVLALNLVLGAALVALLTFRYFEEMNSEIQKRKVALDEEAIAVQVAVQHLWTEHSLESVQGYIDSVVQKMRRISLPCHQIMVRRNGTVLQTTPLPEANGRTEEMIVDMSAGKGLNAEQQSINERGVVVGSDYQDGTAVIVSEELANVRRNIRRDVLTQLGVLGVLGLMAAGIVNFVLLRIVAVPLRQLQSIIDDIGDGNFGAQTSPQGSHEMQQLAETVNAMSHRLLESDRRRQQQMRTAKQIQQYLLPADEQIPGLQAAHLFHPADNVTGDYFDFLPFRDGSWLICVADVTGHGVPAAMGAAMLKSMLMTITEQPPTDPVAILNRLNRWFVHTILPGQFATMFLARWEPEACRLTWTSAGHEPGLLLDRTGRMTILESTGTVLGIDEASTWELRSEILNDGDQLFLFSDGATETFNPAERIFTRDRLIDVFQTCHSESPSTSLHTINEALIAYRGDQPLHDDLTLVVLQCQSTSPTDDRHCSLRPGDDRVHAIEKMGTDNMIRALAPCESGR
ncbi:MAG: SpoIIE family protein phosphatase [Planctomycetaceae bacterium]|nr:SpoIIE family protein phosphatase [Planctomycetaceae bacterium]